MQTITLILGLLVLMQCNSQAVDFVESPSNITQPVGSVAEFRCQHQLFNAVLSWLVNGSLATLFPDATQNNNGNVGTLTIPSVPEYNGIEVVCQALILSDGSTVVEQTPPAILTVIAVEYVPTTTMEPVTTTAEPVTTEMTTTMEPTTTTAEPTTTAVQVQSTTEAMEPTTTTVTTINFLSVPSPPVLIVTMEERHVYMCNHSETINIFWTVNGSRLNVEIFPAEINPVTLQLPGGGRVYTLEIGGRLEHNATTIQCSARLSDGSEVMTPSVSFFMQGPLQSVINLERKNTTISWEAPFSLNLTNVEPNIVYCVEVYNITCGGRELLISDCDVMETIYTSDALQSGYIYEYMVTPRSNVEGAQNGTSKIITEQFVDLQLSTRGHSFSFINNSESGDDNEELKTRIHFDNQDLEQIFDIDAASYSLSLNPLDGFEVESLLMSTIAVRNESSVMLKVSLPYRRLWNYTVLAYDCEEHPLMATNELSTHDIQNISVTSPQPGEVRVTGDFIDGSTATGLLIIIYSLTNDSVVHYITGASNSVSVPGLAGGEYSISVFVVEENGLPFERVATSPKLVAVETNDVVTPPSSSIEYSLQSTSTGVCITCTFLDSSTTDCVAVVHQRISQLSSSGLMNIESSQKLTRSGDTASGCIEGVNMEDYQVGVIGGRCFFPLIKDPSSSIEGSTVGIVLGVLVIILLAVAVVVSLIVVRKRKRTKLHSHIVDIEASGPPIPLSSDDVVHNQPGNEATVNNHYESITVTNHRESRTELDEMSGEVLEPLLSSTPLPTRQGEKWVNSESASEPLLSFPSLPMTPGENRVDSDGSSGLAPSSQDTIETDLSSPSMSNDDRILGDPGPLYDQPQLQGSTDVPPPTDLQHQSNEQESPPPVPLRTEDSKILVQESFNPSPSPQDNTSTNIQSPPDPTYAEPQLTGRAPVQTPSNEDQSFQSPPPLPPITQDREVLLEGFSESSPTQGSPHIAVSIDLAPPPDPTYAEPQLPAVNQPQSKEKQQMSPSGESCGPTYAQPVLSTASPLTSLPPVTEPVVYEDINRFKNSEGQHYAMLGESGKSKKTCRPDDRDQKPTVYVEIQPYSRGPTTPAMCVKQDTSSDKNTATRETHTCTDPPFTVEYIFPTLLFMASKWLAVGEALSLDEDRLDEIFTNNETDEACLRNMLEFYMERCGLKHSWEEIREASKKVEEKDRETEELEPTSQRSPVKKRLDAVTHTDPPFTIEYIFPTLLFMASKWEALGEALSLDEDRLDEIFTNNETDEACLHVMLEFYMERSDLKHNWEEIREAKKKVEEKDGETEELEPTSQRSSMNHQVVAGCNESVSRELENHLASPVPSAPTEVPPHHTTDVASSETHGQASSSSYQIPSYTNSEHDETEGSGADSDGHGDEQKFSSHYDVHVSGNELDELCPNPNTALCLHLDSQKQKIKDNPLLPFSYNEDRDREPTRDPSTSCQGDKSAYKVHQKKSNIKPVRKKGVEFSLPYSPACPKTKPDPERRADELCLKSNSGKVVYMYTKTKLVEEKHTSQVLKGDQIEC